MNEIFDRQRDKDYWDHIDARRDVNDEQDRIEQMAHAEILRCDERFTQWFTDHADAGDHVLALCRHFAHCVTPDRVRDPEPKNFFAQLQLEGQIVADYQAYRIEQEAGK